MSIGDARIIYLHRDMTRSKVTRESPVFLCILVKVYFRYFAFCTVVILNLTIYNTARAKITCNITVCRHRYTL